MRALSLELDDIVVNVEFAPAPEDFELPMGPIEHGSLAGYGGAVWRFWA